ncbi:MAG TPA: ScpA family protein [Methanothrix sp.]|nr:ScpA family protein [Methanothrix sp.]
MSDDTSPSIPDLQENPNLISDSDINSSSDSSSNSSISSDSSSNSSSDSLSNSKSENIPAEEDATDANVAGTRQPEFEFGEPAEVLVELAKRGEIDPWDIDIAMATEKFLQYIDSLEKRDLRIPARTLLYASILLRLKSDSMEEKKEEEPEPEIEEIEEGPEEEIEDQLPRPPVRRHTKRPVTLDELISELKKAEMVGRRKAMRERWPSTEEKALDVSHDEGIEDRIKALGPILDDMFMEKKTVTFQDINSKNSKTEDGVTNYVSLLFMAQRKQVWLEQEEIFGELFVSRHA